MTAIPDSGVAPAEPVAASHGAAKFDSGSISRRRMLAWVGGAAVAQAVSVPWSFALSNGSIVRQERAATPARWRPVFFKKNQALSVARLAEAIIPRTDTAGAIDAKVPEYIDLAISLERPATQTRFLEQLDQMEKACRRLYGAAIRKVSDEQLNEFLARVSDSQAAHPEGLQGAAKLFVDLKERTVFGYYTSLEGRTQELGLPAKTQRVELHGCNEEAELVG